MRPQTDPIKQARRLLRSRVAVLWVVTGEERRAEKGLADAGAREGANVIFWDVAMGASDIEGARVDLDAEQNPVAVLEQIRSGYDKRAAKNPDGRNQPELWILRDLPELWGNPAGPEGAGLIRLLKSTARLLQDEKTPARFISLVILTVQGPEAIPASLDGMTTVMDWPLPDRVELDTVLTDVIEKSETAAPKDKERHAILEAAAGLPSLDAENAFALSLVKHKRVDPLEVARVKKEQIDRITGLEWHEPDPRGLAGISGLSELKLWLNERAIAFSPEAETLRVPLPSLRGTLLIGPSGTGKSLTAKCCATAFGIPLVRLDLGALKGSLVGQSERNIREALKRLDAIRRCVVWCDEMEKALRGSRSGGDSGVAADQLATLLTWLQETESQVFFVGTCNDPSGLQPELLSRFDESWLVDLPQPGERAGALRLSLASYGYTEQTFQGDWKLDALSPVTDGYSGRELHKLVGAAMWRALGDGRRPVRTADLLAVAAKTIPVSKTAAEEVNALREWCKGRCRPASIPESLNRNISLAASGGRTVALDGKEDLN